MITGHEIDGFEPRIVTARGHCHACMAPMADIDLRTDPEAVFRWASTHMLPCVPAVRVEIIPGVFMWGPAPPLT